MGAQCCSSPRSSKYHQADSCGRGTSSLPVSAHSCQAVAIHGLVLLDCMTPECQELATLSPVLWCRPEAPRPPQRMASSPSSSRIVQHPSHVTLASPPGPGAWNQPSRAPLSHLDADGARLQPAEAALVKGIEGLIAHDTGLQHIAAVPASQEQGLVHLHGLVCKSGLQWTPAPVPGRTLPPAAASPGVWKLRATSWLPQIHMGRGS